MYLPLNKVADTPFHIQGDIFRLNVYYRPRQWTIIQLKPKANYCLAGNVVIEKCTTEDVVLTLNDQVFVLVFNYKVRQQLYPSHITFESVAHVKKN